MLRRCRLEDHGRAMPRPMAFRGVDVRGHEGQDQRGSEGEGRAGGENPGPHLTPIPAAIVASGPGPVARGPVTYSRPALIPPAASSLQVFLPSTDIFAPASKAMTLSIRKRAIGEQL
jgi:hypothetical protein